MDAPPPDAEGPAAIHDAQIKALRHGHTPIDVEQLLLALLKQPDGLVSRLLKRTNVNIDALHADVEQRCSATAGTGSGATGQARISRALSVLLNDADKEAEHLKDDCVSVEHPMLAKPSPPRRQGGCLSSRRQRRPHWNCSHRYAARSAYQRDARVNL